MLQEEFEARLKQILPKGASLSRQHLAELLRDDPVLRVAPFLALIDEAMSNGILEEVDTPDGPAIKAVASSAADKR
jgi:hypothetical protein